MSFADVIELAARKHRQRTEKAVAVRIGAIPHEPPCPIKIVSSGQVADSGPPGAQPGQPLDGRANFFRETWGSACGVFMTVLGPEANRAHRNHLHVDLAQRKTGAFCQ